VRLFGQLSVQNTGSVCTIPGGKACRLLAYLLLHGRTACPRARLAHLFWPDAPADRARRNLSDTLYRLRQALGDGWLATTQETIGIAPDTRLDVDLWRFEAAIKSGDIPALIQAIGLYQGELVSGFDDDWVLAPRVAFHESFLDALEKVGRDAEERRDLGKALLHYRRLAQEDPLREGGHQGMMRALAGQQRFREALHIYEALERTLRREIDAPPGAVSRRLAARIRDEAEVAAFQQTASVSAPRPMPFTGRLPERATAIRALDETGNGHGSVLVLEGEAGMGKSRFLAHIRESADWRDMAMLSGRATQYPRASPFAPLVEALSPALTSPRAVPVAEALADETLAALALIFPKWRPLGRLPTLPGDQAQTRLYEALVDLIEALTDYAPHALILDDMHWAEPTLWGLLTALAARIPHQRLLLVLGYRRSQLEDAGFLSTLQSWESQVRVRVIRLSPLSVDEVARLLPVESKLDAAAVHGVTGGNPFFIQEYLFNVQAGEPDHQSTVAGRMDLLSTDARQALEAAAVIGDRVPFRLWRDLLHMSTEKLALIGGLLTDRALLHPQPGGYAFIHDLVQVSIYAEIPQDRQRRYHARVAELLASEPQDAQLRLLALHLDRAGETLAAARTYAKAGQYELRLFAFIEARAAFERALALTPDEQSGDRVETLLALAKACNVLGERTRQKRALNEALELSATLNDQALLIRSAVQLGHWATRTGEHAEAETRLDAALALVQARGDQTQELEIYQILGDLHLRKGDHREAWTLLRRALDLARQLDDQPQEGRALEGLAWVESQLGGGNQEVLDLFQQALKVQRACQDRMGEARTLLNLFSAYQNQGAWDRMLAMSADVLAAQRDIHFPLGQGIAHQALGLADYALGDFVHARENVMLALTRFEAVGERLGVVITTNTLGLIALHSGDTSAAEAHHREALALAEEIGSIAFEAFTLQDLSFLLAGAGRWDEAIPLLRRAIVNWAQSGDPLALLKCEACLGLALLDGGMLRGGDKAAWEEAETLADRGWAAHQRGDISGEELQTWLWTLARLHRVLGRDEAADALVQAAYQKIQRQARAIADHATRARFFRHGPRNRAIVSAHDALTGMVRQQQATLARAGARQGRAQEEDERVDITWTVLGPEDEGIESRAERRQVALRRLLREAAAQGAAPTDQDLAAALGVSRRTVIRDRKILRIESG